MQRDIVLCDIVVRVGWHQIKPLRLAWACAAVRSAKGRLKRVAGSVASGAITPHRSPCRTGIDPAVMPPEIVKLRRGDQRAIGRDKAAFVADQHARDAIGKAVSAVICGGDHQLVLLVDIAPFAARHLHRGEAFGKVACRQIVATDFDADTVGRGIAPALIALHGGHAIADGAGRRKGRIIADHHRAIGTVQVHPTAGQFDGDHALGRRQRVLHFGQRLDKRLAALHQTCAGKAGENAVLGAGDATAIIAQQPVDRQMIGQKCAVRVQHIPLILVFKRRIVGGLADGLIVIIRQRGAVQINQPPFAALLHRKPALAGIAHRLKLRRGDPRAITAHQPPQIALFQRHHALMCGPCILKAGLGHPSKRIIRHGGRGEAGSKDKGAHGQAPVRVGAACDGLGAVGN